MRPFVTAAVCLCAAASPLFTSAQTHRDEHIADLFTDTKIVVIDGETLTPEESDSVRRVISTFYYDQFRHFDDPEAPYFMFMSRDAKLSMGIGGKVKLTGWYEWGGAVPDKGLVPYLIPIPEDPAARTHLGTDIGGTALFFRVIGRNAKVGLYSLYIEAGFSGYKNRDFKLKKAYATLRDFTVGYASSTFSDPSTLAPDVDAQGATSQFDLTRVLVRYMPTFADRYTVAVSAEYPTDLTIQDTDDASALDVSVPDFAAFAQYSWAKGSHLRLSGILRTMGYRDLVAGRNHHITGWGTQLSAVGSVGRAVTLYGQANYGLGMAGMTQDLGAGEMDLLVDPAAAPGTLYSPKSWGWNAGVQYDFSKSVFASVQASQTRLLPGHPVEPSTYKYGLYAAANIYWAITPRIKVAGQFTWGQRHNFDGTHRAARRLEAQAAFSF